MNNETESSPPDARQPIRTDPTQPWTPEHCRSYPTEAARLLNERSSPPDAARAPTDDERAINRMQDRLKELTDPEDKAFVERAVKGLQVDAARVVPEIPPAGLMSIHHLLGGNAREEDVVDPTERVGQKPVAVGGDSRRLNDGNV